jgi:hypothetical protein
MSGWWSCILFAGGRTTSELAYNNNNNKSVAGSWTTSILIGDVAANDMFVVDVNLLSNESVGDVVQVVQLVFVMEFESEREVNPKAIYNMYRYHFMTIDKVQIEQTLKKVSLLL